MTKDPFIPPLISHQPSQSTAKPAPIFSIAKLAPAPPTAAAPASLYFRAAPTPITTPSAAEQPQQDPPMLDPATVASIRSTSMNGARVTASKATAKQCATAITKMLSKMIRTRLVSTMSESVSVQDGIELVLAQAEVLAARLLADVDLDIESSGSTSIPAKVTLPTPPPVWATSGSDEHERPNPGPLSPATVVPAQPPPPAMPSTPDFHRAPDVRIAPIPSATVTPNAVGSDSASAVMRKNFPPLPFTPVTKPVDEAHAGSTDQATVFEPAANPSPAQTFTQFDIAYAAVRLQSVLPRAENEAVGPVRLAKSSNLNAGLVCQALDQMLSAETVNRKNHGRGHVYWAASHLPVLSPFGEVPDRLRYIPTAKVP